MTAQIEAAARRIIPMLAAANFIIGIGAFLVIGAMVPIIEDLGVSAARGGWIMTSYAIGYAVLSPVLVSVTGGIGRQRLSGPAQPARSSSVCVSRSSQSS